MSEEIARVWFVRPDGDDYQHGTTERPPHVGGVVTTLCDRTVEAPPAALIKPRPVRPYCSECMMFFLGMPHSPITLWSY